MAKYDPFFFSNLWHFVECIVFLQKHDVFCCIIQSYILCLLQALLVSFATTGEKTIAAVMSPKNKTVS